MKINYKQERENLRNFLVSATDGCNIQSGWPCGTCIIYLLTKLGLDDKKKEYKERNEKPSRHNEVWRAILQIRDAKIRNAKKGKEAV